MLKSRQDALLKLIYGWNDFVLSLKIKFFDPASQSCPYKIHCKCKEELTSSVWPMLFTHSPLIDQSSIWVVNNKSITVLPQFLVGLRQQFTSVKITNITSKTNMLRTNHTKNMFFDFPLAAYILQSFDKWNCLETFPLSSNLNLLLKIYRIPV